MRYDTIVDLVDFNNKIDINAKLDGSVIQTKDLAQFAPALKNFHDQWYIEGDFEGKVNDFKVEDFVLNYG